MFCWKQNKNIFIKCYIQHFLEKDISIYFKFFSIIFFLICFVFRVLVEHTIWKSKKGKNTAANILQRLLHICVYLSKRRVSDNKLYLNPDLRLNTYIKQPSLAQNPPLKLPTESSETAETQSYWTGRTAPAGTSCPPSASAPGSAACACPARSGDC